MRPALTALFLMLNMSAANADIMIGIAGPMSGQNAVYGAELRNGVSGAISYFNAAGGINGEPLTLVEADDNCDARRAGDAAKELIGKDVRLVVGHFCSSPALAAAPAYADAGVLMITPSATAPELTSKSLWNVFRITGREDLQADMAAARIKLQKLDAEVLVVSDGQVETQALMSRFRNALPRAKDLTVKAGDAKLAESPDLLTAQSAYLALQSSDAAVVAKELRRLNATIAIYGPDFLQSEIYGNRAEAAANDTRVSFLADLLPKAEPRRVAQLPSSEGATLAAFAAVEVFVAAAKARSVNDSKAMAAWLSGGNEVTTIIGPVRFNASGDLQDQPYVWYRWQDGVLKPDFATP